MLIDEADIYMESRMHQDLQRNSLVSGKQELRLDLFLLISCYRVSPSTGALSKYSLSHDE